MRSVGTRELKQNPQAVIKRVLETGDEYEITAYGRPTGARIIPDRHVPRRWVSGRSLASVPPMDTQNRAAWRRDVEDAMGDEISDPWDKA